MLIILGMILLSRCLEFMKGMTELVLKEDDFLNLSEHALTLFLYAENMNISDEMLLFEAVIRWAKSNINNQSSTRNTLRRKLKYILPLIRFPTVDAKSFVRVVTSSEDSCSVLNMKEKRDLCYYMIFKRPYGNRWGYAADLHHVAGYSTQPRPLFIPPVPFIDHCHLLNNTFVYTYPTIADRSETVIRYPFHDDHDDGNEEQMVISTNKSPSFKLDMKKIRSECSIM